MKRQRSFLIIDLKSFYASVECVDKGLDPMTALLAAADKDRSKGTICLAITPAMKALDILAKHSPDFIAELDEESFKERLWQHRPLTDF